MTVQIRADKPFSARQSPRISSQNKNSAVNFPAQIFQLFRHSAQGFCAARFIAVNAADRNQRCARRVARKFSDKMLAFSDRRKSRTLAFYTVFAFAFVEIGWSFFINHHFFTNLAFHFNQRKRCACSNRAMPKTFFRRFY
jgi:hypothetical protein